MAKLEIDGACVGVLESDKCTASILNDELAKRSKSARNSINLICEGQILKESDKNPKVAVRKMIVADGKSLREQLQDEELRSARVALHKKKLSAKGVQRNVCGCVVEQYDGETSKGKGQVQVVPSEKREGERQEGGASRSNSKRWSDEEQILFLKGLEKYGRGKWKDIAREFVTTRTCVQIASHAQKYFQRRDAPAGTKKRKSINDIHM